MTFVLWPEETGTRGDLGGKARALAEMQQAGLPIPAWFVLTPAAFYDSLTVAQQIALETGDVRAAATVLRGELRLDVEPRCALVAALERLCPNGEPVAVRSSASDEDGSEHSFAGQFDSFLFVPGDAESVAERAADVWRSAFNQRVVAYREQHGLPDIPQPPSVLIQRMVCADRSGVAFGADPVSGRRGMAVVAAVWGMGTALVSGECDADTYHVDRTGRICARDIAVKRTAHLPSPGTPEGVEPVTVPDTEATRAVLSDDQVLAVADLVRKAGCDGHPRDIEWAIEEGRLWLLQSRPITTLAHVADPDGALNLWDNSNIAESYNGITTPLTFSFARRAYAEVYRQMCRTLGVSRLAIAANDEIFGHMLGFVRGRVYYNLLNWYRLLVLLPGFTSNRRFMEQMMGVREGLPDNLVAEIASAGRAEKLRDRLRMIGTFSGILANYMFLPGRIRKFHLELNDALAPPDPPLASIRADELAALYRRMEQRLLTHWDAPLVNDLFAMIFHGMLGKLTARWCRDTDGSLRNDMVRGQGGMISAEPALRVREMAEAIASDKEMLHLLQTDSAHIVVTAIEQRPALRARYHNYLERFGDRCLEELKLESPTLHDDPTPLHRAIGRLAEGITNAKTPQRDPERAQTNGDRPILATASPSSLPITPAVNLRPSASSAERVPLLLRPLFNWVLRNARDRVRDRENLRFERTRLFGRVRRIFVEIGRRLSADGQLRAPRDVFYLEVEEILGFITGTATCTDLQGLVELRKAEFERYRRMDAPDDRFETHGVVYAANTFHSALTSDSRTETGGNQSTLKGIACCPGVVIGRVRLILDPRGAEISPGSILAAERTDPGWVMLFPGAAGLLVQHGSLLSHSAIVAREMGIPAIVSIPGLTRQIKDGDLVEMDGSTGIVRRIDQDAIRTPAAPINLLPTPNTQHLTPNPAAPEDKPETTAPTPHTDPPTPNTTSAFEDEPDAVFPTPNTQHPTPTPGAVKAADHAD